MNYCFAFCRPPPTWVSSLFAVCFRLCWLPLSFILSAFIWRISSIIYYWECYMDCSTAMKKLALSVGTLCCSCGLAPTPLTPFAWLDCCWWGVACLNSTCEGTALIFHVIFLSRGHNLRGLYLPSLSFSQLSSGVANLNVVGIFYILG